MKNLASLDLNLLVALESLLEEASVGRAAKRVALSQPGMSHALKRLRSALGDPLLVRVGGRMQRTARAEALRHPLRDALARVRDVLAGETFQPQRSTRTFRMFVSDNAADLLLPVLLRRLQQEAPGIRVRVQSAPGMAQDSFELARSLDVAVACFPGSFPSFYQQRLFVDRDCCAMRRAHPLRRRLTHDRFLNARHVAVVGRDFGEDPVDTWLREEGCARNVILTVPHYLQALHVVAESDLIAVIPERLVLAYSGVLDVAAIEVPLDVGTFEEYLLHPSRNHSDPGCIWFRGLLKDIAASLGDLKPRARARKQRSQISHRG